MAYKIYTPLISGDDTGERSAKIAAGLFTNGVGEITTIFTSSTQVTTNGEYVISAYNAVTTDATSEVQFSISYGNALGSGSANTNDSKPTKAIYSQYRNLLLEPGDTRFTFAGGVDSDSIVVLNLKRSRFKENIDPGNWELKLSNGTRTVTLTDDSLQSLGTGQVSGVSPSGKKYYNIVEGTIATGPSGSRGVYGLLYQELGLMILNADAINVSMSLANSSYLSASITTPVPNNNERMHNLIKTGASFKARNEETLNSQYYFIRMKSKEYNLSNNPTYVSGSVGRIIDTITKRGVPFTYVTGIGLYDDAGNLLATAKLSKPLFKEPGTEALVKIRLDF